MSGFHVSSCLYAVRCPSPVLKHGQRQDGQTEKDTHSCADIAECGTGVVTVLETAIG